MRLYFEAVIVVSFGNSGVTVSKEVDPMPITFILVLVPPYGTTKKLVLHTGSVSMTGKFVFCPFSDSSLTLLLM